MSSRRRAAAAVVVGGLLFLPACGDDGNDRASSGRHDAARAAELAAEFRAANTVPATILPAVEDGPCSSVSTLPPAVVVALDNSFRPEVVHVEVGDEVLWENRGLNDHNVLYIDGDDWGVEVEGFGPGAVYAHMFTAPGEYRYYCSIHGNEVIGMVGTVIVDG